MCFDWIISSTGISVTPSKQTKISMKCNNSTSFLSHCYLVKIYLMFPIITSSSSALKLKENRLADGRSSSSSRAYVCPKHHHTGEYETVQVSLWTPS